MKFVQIGGGVMGEMRARAVSSHPDCTLVGVADPNTESAERAAGSTGARVVADAGELLAGDHCDAVIVSTPLPLHEKIILDALAAGKHVLVEKPLATTLDACTRIHEAAEASGCAVAVGFNHRFYPSFAYMQRVIAEGRIGRVDSVRVMGGHDGLANFRQDWMYKSEMSGGGAMMDIGIHMTDLVRFMVGEIDSVFATTGNAVWNVEGSEDRAHVIMNTTAGASVLYEATWNEWKGYEVWMEAYGDQGMIRAQYGPMVNVLITQSRPGAARKKERNFYPEVVLREKLKGWETTAQKSFEDELAQFLRQIAGEPTLGASDWDGLRAVEIANAVVASGERGELVRLSAAPASGE